MNAAVLNPGAAFLEGILLEKRRLHSSRDSGRDHLVRRLDWNGAAALGVAPRLQARLQYRVQHGIGY
jgi:hypothetical protein